MNTREAESLVYKYMAKHELPDEWLFRWQNKKSALGTCSYNKKEIRLSKWYVELNDVVSVRDTILHEIAHALSYVYYGSEGIGHGKLWKDICRQIGAIPKACSKENLIRPKITTSMLRNVVVLHIADIVCATIQYILAPNAEKNYLGVDRLTLTI